MNSFSPTFIVAVTALCYTIGIAVDFVVIKQNLQYFKPFAIRKSFDAKGMLLSGNLYLMPNLFVIDAFIDGQMWWVWALADLLIWFLSVATIRAVVYLIIKTNGKLKRNGHKVSITSFMKWFVKQWSFWIGLVSIGLMVFIISDGNAVMAAATVILSCFFFIPLHYVIVNIMVNTQKYHHWINFFDEYEEN